jgi:hypothetical protein
MTLLGKMEKEAQYLCASVRFNNAVEMLRKLNEGIGLYSIEQEEFKKLGDLFGEIDWELKDSEKEKHPELCVRATYLRPLFYQSVLETGVPNERFAINLYQTLKSGGEQVNLSSEEIIRAQEIFVLMSRKSLNCLRKYNHSGQI